MPNEKTLVILAAGMGSRFGGLKQVQPVGPSGELIIDYSVYDALRAGFTRMVAVIRHENEDEFLSAVGNRLARHIALDYAYQKLTRLPTGFTVPRGRTKPWGTGQAVLAAMENTNTRFGVINADDLYGAGSFAVLGRFLDRVDVGSSNYALVGFPLSRTLSEAGAVSRGICEIGSDGNLRRVVERTNIHSGADGIGFSDEGGSRYPLRGDEVVSMNMWGFTPTVFSQLETRFSTFLEADGGKGNGEFYLPEAIDDLIAAGGATVRTLSTDESWFGVTYREDLEGCRRAIQAKIDAGVYRDPLWA
jgi:dTDP-glucose pyrophosphorylase